MERLRFTREPKLAAVRKVVDLDLSSIKLPPFSTAALAPFSTAISNSRDTPSAYGIREGERGRGALRIKTRGCEYEKVADFIRMFLDDFYTDDDEGRIELMMHADEWISSTPVVNIKELELLGF